MQLYFADGATHTDTHTDKNETQVNSKEPRSQGERQAGVAAWLGTCTLEGGVLRGAAPANGRAARPTVTHVGLVSAAEPKRPRAGIRVADRTQRETGRGRVSSVVIGIDRTDRSTNEERPCTTTHRLVKKLSVCQSSSYTELKTPAKLQRMPQRMQN